MRKYFFDKTNIRNILAITGLLFAFLTFMMFFVTGSKGYSLDPITGSSTGYIFSASLFALAFGKGCSLNMSTASWEDWQLKLFNPGQSIILIVAFTLALAALLIAITVAIGLLYKKFNRKVLLGLSITGIVLLFGVFGTLFVSNALNTNQALTNMFNIYVEQGYSGSDYDEFIKFMFEKCFFKVQPAIGTILGCVFSVVSAGSGIAAVIFTRYSISNRE